MNKAQRVAFKNLAKKMGKDEGELAEELGLDITEEKDETPDETKVLIKALSRALGDKEDEEDDDDDEPKKTRKIAASKKSKTKSKKAVRASHPEPDDDDDDDDGDDEDGDDDEGAQAVSEAKRIVREAVDPIVASITSLTKKLEEGNKTVEATRKAQEQRDAEEAVGTLIKAGKVLPAQKEHYVKLYANDPDLFTQITASLPRQVNFGGGDDGVPVGDYDYEKPDGGRLTATEVATEADRYSKLMASTRTGGFPHGGNRVADAIGRKSEN